MGYLVAFSFSWEEVSPIFHSSKARQAISSCAGHTDTLLPATFEWLNDKGSKYAAAPAEIGLVVICPVPIRK